MEIKISGDRPHFRRPPLNEVACGVQFQAIENWKTTDYGRFWARIQPTYSQTEDQPPLLPVPVENASSSEPVITNGLPPLRRVFFIEPPGNFLIQLQENRFLHNWRKMQPQDEYPRFDTAYERFSEYWTEFKSFLADSRFSEARPELWELTYTNHIVAEGFKFPKDVWTFLNFYQQSPAPIVPADPAGIMMHFAWPFPEGSGVLVLNVRHGVRTTDSESVLFVELSMRSKARGVDSDMQSWFGSAHHAIVNTFDKLTTEHAHKTWGKF